MSRGASQVLAELVGAHARCNDARFNECHRELACHLAALESVAAEYNAWISAACSTTDFDAWLAKRLEGQVAIN